MWWASSNILRAWTDQKDRGRVNLSLFFELWHLRSWFLGLWTRTKSHHWPSWQCPAHRQQIMGLLGLHKHMNILPYFWNFILFWLEYSWFTILWKFLLYSIVTQAYILFLFLFFFAFRATPMAFRGSQAKGRIRTIAAGLHHSYNSTRSKPCLWPTPQLTVMDNTRSSTWVKPRIEPATSWLLVGFVSFLLRHKGNSSTLFFLYYLPSCSITRDWI